MDVQWMRDCIPRWCLILILCCHDSILLVHLPAYRSVAATKRRLGRNTQLLVFPNVFAMTYACICHLLLKRRKPQSLRSNHCVASGMLFCAPWQKLALQRSSDIDRPYTVTGRPFLASFQRLCDFQFVSLF